MKNMRPSMVTWKLCPQAGFDTKNIFLELLLKIWSRYTKHKMASDRFGKHLEILRSILIWYVNYIIYSIYDI